MPYPRLGVLVKNYCEKVVKKNMPKHQRISSTRTSNNSRGKPLYSRKKDTSKVGTQDVTIAVCVADELGRLLQKAGNPNDGQAMKKYMRNQFEFFGVKTPQRKAITKQVFSTKTFLSSEILSIAKSLWTRDQREFQYCGVDMLLKYKALLTPDLNTCRQSVVIVRDLITEKSWWDTVDSLASNVIGYMAQTQPDHMKPVLDEWIVSENLWLRRTAILHQLKYKQDTDQATLFRYCLQCSKEKEFFIQKAIGWALREYHKARASAVREFVTKHKKQLATLSVKEALKHD